VTAIFRIDAVELDTDEGAVRYEFPSDLTVLAGPTGVGKTTLLEMIKYGLTGFHPSPASHVCVLS
jgi:DNA repair exonuclease SbcCD ATPase subunit